MTVRELIKELSNIENWNAEITIIGNVGIPENEDDDISFNNLELWEDGESTITLFISK